MRQFIPMRRVLAVATLGALFWAAPATWAAAPPEAASCIACHGADGNSPSPAFPRIAGQHPEYLLQALFDYKAGKRKNPIMAAQVEALSKQDMSDLAAWFGAQQGLYVKR